MEKIHVSQEGLEKMKAELQKMKERRMVVAAAIEKARDLGDLRENADYHAAKEEQAMLHAYMGDLEDKISRAEIIDESKIDASTARVGATVRVRNKKTNKEFTYTLVSHVEADMAAGKLSVKSPVGAALLGKGVGDVATAKVPAGNIDFEVLELKREV
jgi:transcription elongation factor GreA